jgi:hypothetical protein
MSNGKICPILSAGFHANSRYQPSGHSINDELKNILSMDLCVMCKESLCMAYENGRCKLIDKPSIPFMKSSDIIKGEK